MIRIHVGDASFELSFASAAALRATLDVEIALEERKFDDRIAAMLLREPRKPWKRPT